ncbi:MAG: amidohydrolase family protein [Candidatus Binatia bacterium]
MNERIVLLSICLWLLGVPASLGNPIPVPKGVDTMTPTPERLRRVRRRHVMMPMPKLPFKIDRRLLSHNRPARAYGKPYQGPMIDVHVHLNTRSHKDTSLKELNEVVNGIREAGVELAVVMPTPNEGRIGGHKKRRMHRKLLKELGGKTIRVMCCGNTVGQWIHHAYYDTYTKEALDAFLQRLAMDLDSGIYTGVGEFGLYHFNKNGRQPIIRYPPNFEPFVKAVDLIAKRGYWITLHAETVDPKGTSYEDKFFAGIELLYKRNPNLKLIIAHTSTTNPDNVRWMLQRYPNLMMDFKIVKRLKSWWYTEPVNNAKRELHEDWAQLFEEMPERFMVGTDDKFFRRRMDAEKYKRRNRRMRKVLGTLDPKAARMIAYENAKGVFGERGP